MAKAKKKDPKPGDPDWRIVKAHEANFETLTRAFRDERVCIMDCILKSTKEHVAVITALGYDAETKEYIMYPLAMFFNGNPYEMLESPLEQDQLTQEEINNESKSNRTAKDTGRQDKGNDNAEG